MHVMVMVMMMTISRVLLLTQCHIRITGPPAITLYLQDTNVKIGSVAKVICQVDGFPKAEVDMIFNGQDAKKIPGIKFHELYNGAKIVFEAKYSSEVICYAKNEFGERKKTLKVRVKGK